MQRPASTLSSRLAAWIGVVSAGATVVMTLLNFVVKSRIDEQTMRLDERRQAFEELVRARSQELEAARDDIDRYRFVYEILSDVAGKDEGQRTVLVNVARIALRPEEEEQLFASMARAEDVGVAQVGRLGVSTINEEKSSLSVAREKEREGFLALLEGDYARAAAAFQASENAYNSYHQVYELARLVRQNLDAFEDERQRKALFRRIASEYAYGAPRDLLERIEAAAR